jgi:glycine/D-amino acid oxidase-like deaminating enzyme
MAEPAYDVAIVGGGLVGVAIAYGLVRLGRRVVVLDEGDIAQRASRANFALVWIQAKGLGMPAYAAWSVGSAHAWSGFARELEEASGIPIHFVQPGGFHLCLSEEELEARQRTLLRFHNQPGVVQYRTDILRRGEMLDRMPDIGPDVVGGSYCPLDGHVNSLKLYRALHTALHRAGAAYLPGHPVTGIGRAGEGFRITTPHRIVEAARVVLAAGNANQQLAPQVGLSAPMRPERGQVLVTQRTAPFLHYPLSTLRQTDEGTVMIGDSREEGTDPLVMRQAINATMAGRAVRMFPRLAGLNIVRSWSAIRVMPQDGFPIYEQSATMPGAFVATCHSGVTLAAAHATRLAPMIDRGRLDAAMQGFSARRFDVQAAG